jgi:glutathione S-transferase
MWGRNTSSNVQKAMWAVGELKLPCERIDVGGAYGKTKEPFYLAMNPNSLVPTLEEEDGFTLWESNSVVRYLAGKHGGTLEPKDRRCAPRRTVDGLAALRDGPAITPVFWGLIRTPPEKRDQARSMPARTRPPPRPRSWTSSSARRGSSRAMNSPTATFRSAS